MRLLPQIAHARRNFVGNKIERWKIKGNRMAECVVDLMIFSELTENQQVSIDFFLKAPDIDLADYASCRRYRD